jgi:hypothetical protein
MEFVIFETKNELLMKLDRVKQILKKVNALIENLDEQGQTSAIERDLLLRYLRDLYENVSQPKAAIDTILEEVDLTQSPIAQQPRPQAKQPQVVTPAPAVEPAPPEQAIEPNPVAATETTSERIQPAPAAPIRAPEKSPSPQAQENQTTFYDASVAGHAQESESKPEAPVSTPLEEAVINKFENPVQYFPPTDESNDLSLSIQNTDKDVAAPLPAATSSTPTIDVESLTSETEIATPVSTVETTSQAENVTPTVQTSEQARPSVSATETLVDTSGRFDTLFAEKKAQDIAAKFQLQKVVTIESAMGIAERMLTINEIFGGEHNEFMQVVTHINGLSDFNSAKKYLIEGVASKYDWDSDERKKLAGDFVQLVRRKFA